DVERDAELVGVNVVEEAATVDAGLFLALRVLGIGRHEADEIQRRVHAPLDADDLGAEIRQDARAARAGEEARQVDHADARQDVARKVHFPSRVRRWPGTKTGTIRIPEL